MSTIPSMNDRSADDRGYFATLFSRFGTGWNLFWFTPADPLPLGVMRIAVGLIAFYLVATFGLDLRRFLDPQIGLLRIETVQLVRTGMRISYLDYVTDAATLQIVHYAGLAILAAFVVGFQTRITSVLAWIVFMGYFHRAPMLTSIAEPVVAVLMMYLCLGPCGATLSLDSRLRRRRNPTAVAMPTWGANVVLRLIQVHTVLIYFMMFCGKTQNNFAWWNGTAVWWLIAKPESALLNLRWMADAPYLVNLWTSAIMFFELAFPFLVWNRTARPLMLGLSVVMWTGIAVLTGLVPFALAMFVAGLSFVSADGWRKLCGSRRKVVYAR
jgi:hypothetical protein